MGRRVDGGLIQKMQRWVNPNAVKPVDPPLSVSSWSDCFRGNLIDIDRT